MFRTPPTRLEQYAFHVFFLGWDKMFDSSWVKRAKFRGVFGDTPFAALINLNLKQLRNNEMKWQNTTLRSSLISGVFLLVLIKLKYADYIDCDFLFLSMLLFIILWMTNSFFSTYFTTKQNIIGYWTEYTEAYKPKSNVWINLPTDLLQHR